MILKLFIPILICTIEIAAFISSPNVLSESISKNALDELRLSYYAGVEEEDYIDTLQISIEQNYGSDISQYPAVVLAYHAGVEALKSKHAFWPFTKMSYLNDSMDLFERAIKIEPDNLEIRFMRFSILYYVPGILGYDEEESEDLQKVYELLLSKDFKLVSYEIQSGMVEFLMQSELLTNEQEQKLANNFVLAEIDE